VTPATSGGGELVPRPSAAVDALRVRSGAELADLTEVLYVRLVVIALHGLQFVCAGAVIFAVVRTSGADFARTVALAVLITGLAGLALRVRVRIYRAMRRRPLLSLVPPLLALTALVVDGVSHSPMSYVAAVAVALTGFINGRRWGLVAAVLVSVGAVTAAVLRTGLGALDSVGQGTSGYFVWALVCSGLAESFALLTIRMPQAPPPPAGRAPPVRVANLAGDPPPTTPATPPTPPSSTESASVEAPPAPADSGQLTARQWQVVALLADGLQAEAIAARLGITTSAVYRHVERAKERAGVRTRSELVSLAVRDGIVPPGEVPA
jgi:DNA-binding CsgD family transcriptional regulator